MPRGHTQGEDDGGTGKGERDAAVRDRNNKEATRQNKKGERIRWRERREWKEMKTISYPTALHVVFQCPRSFVPSSLSLSLLSRLLNKPNWLSWDAY